MASDEAQRYGENVGRFIADHERFWIITVGPGGFGYSGWRRIRGRGHGERYSALTLDQLAAILQREQNRRQATN